MRVEEVIERLRAVADEEFLRGMSRFGIATGRALGVHIPELRRIARETGRDHALALALYDVDLHEVKILASMIADPELFTPEDMDRWVCDFDSWDLCDQCCMNLFRHVPFAYDKVTFYSASPELFTRRAGFALLATLASGDRRADDGRFAAFFDLIRRGADDERDTIRKVVDWALRQIGKRNEALRLQALRVADELADDDRRAARWIGRNARRELSNERVAARVRRRKPFAG